MLDFWKSLAGMVELELVSADFTGFLADISCRNITVYNLEQKDALCSYFTVFRKSYKNIAKICEARGDTLTLRRKKGLYWKLKRITGRPVLTTGMILLLSLVLWIPSRVFFVKVDGNVGIPSDRIIEAAESCGIYFGVSRSAVRSEKMKNALLLELPQLKWAGVNTKGCVATISVREKVQQEESKQGRGIRCIVAGLDGVIESVVVLRGSALCREGQLVRKGQTLISGYTDCGIFLQVAQAEGEVIAQTFRELSVVTPTTRHVRQGETSEKKDYSLLLGKKRIKLWKDSGIWDSTCGRMYKEYYVTLPGGFQLPLGIGVDHLFQTQALLQIKTPEAVQNCLSEYASAYLSQQMIAGHIIRQDISLSQHGESYILNGVYACSEMIGRAYWEQIGE